MAAAKTTLDKIVEIPISEIHADYGWNCRQGDPAERGDSAGELPGNEFASLVESIGARGQDTPIIVRMKGQKYSVVAGFRRYRAMLELAKGNKNYPVKAVVRELTELEAKSLNIRENSARDDLRPADLMCALIDLKTLYIAAKGAPTAAGIASEVGIGRSYAQKLMGIYDKVAPKHIKAWRESKVEIGVNKLEALAKLDKGEQQDREWETNIAPSKGRGAGGGVKGKAWLDRAEAEAVKVGDLLGALERFKKIDTASLDFEKDLELCITMKEGEQAATAKERAKLVKVISEAYEQALTFVLQPDPPAKEPAAAKGNAKAPALAAVKN